MIDVCYRIVDLNVFSLLKCFTNDYSAFMFSAQRFILNISF